MSEFDLVTKFSYELYMRSVLTYEHFLFNIKQESIKTMDRYDETQHDTWQQYLVRFGIHFFIQKVSNMNL
jgi:hypothetical protein